MAYTIEAVNAMDAETFGRVFADVAEHSPWVAAAACSKRPFANREELVDAFVQAMHAATPSRQRALIKAHPDLAGKAARAGEVAAASREEQAGAGLDSLTDAEYEEFTRLNTLYRKRFGFPFIFAVKGATKQQILAGFEPRLHNDAPTEFQEALRQIERILRFRLEALVLEPTGKDQ
ncbi:2-oxo-4-hydroxy-4-carboxy-5-ureidoimidazoline decarboxylase [Pseudovibrio exalbescens]|uniref:2-oxo-4-hydroxy-4-carboxy-5-ureidoimidazoline decarboxylase n=1 Tax=Pseudovibrio exalbescens TaxID=197461 RepID=UPI001AD94E33|nr:2-oxo-4-hydroxy-4-carboxy-5-ureidoimidazoline decarboxylase [Pseudovibrio exalbescens]